MSDRLFFRVLLFVFATVANLGAVSAADTDRVSEEDRKVLYDQLAFFGRSLEFIRESYVEVPDLESLIEAAVGGMLSSLDPHSDYLDREAFESLKTQTSGKFGGLGIQVTMEDGLVHVVSPIDDTPAMRAGIMSGDLIVYLDDEAVRGLSLSEAISRMRGEPGDAITLSIKRKGWNDLMKVRIIREMITVHSVRHRVERDSIGYLRVTAFNAETADALEDAVGKIQSEVENKPLKGYILDLRNNPGGLLTQAVRVSDMFLDRGEIVSTRGRESASTIRYNAGASTLVKDIPVVVLINAGSASASEIVAGALQDQKRAVILGTRSFGKGSVQSVIPLDEDQAIRLTTALYYTPSGRSIQAKGIRPDIVVKPELPDEWKGRWTHLSYGESALRGHLEESDKGLFPDSDDKESEKDDDQGTVSLAYIPKDPRQDTQLQYGLDLLEGLVEGQSIAGILRRGEKESAEGE